MNDKQINFADKLVKAIADFTGYSYCEMLEYMLRKYEDLQSIPDGKDSENFIEKVVEFALFFGIPVGFELGVLEARRIVYWRIKYGLCLLCDRPSDLHHSDAIGMGRNRDKFEPGNVPLCRIHHTEIHTTGKEKFVKKYHLQDYLYLWEEESCTQ